MERPDIVLKNSSKSHTTYFLSDGTRIPSVTSILSVMAKPGLITWANRKGFEGIDTSKYIEAAATAGTCCHYMVECHVKKVEPDLSKFPPNLIALAENGYLKWLDWERSFGTFRLIYSEKALISELYQYGGTIDLFVEAGGKHFLVDLKTGDKSIWPENRHQVAAYRQLLLEDGKVVDEIIIVRVGKQDTNDFQMENVKNIDKHFELFLHAKAILRLQYELRGSNGS